MPSNLVTTIPAAAELVFRNGISHPDLWLWDSWSLRVGDHIHLYCLALGKTADNGAPIKPHDRNDHSFHVRHFVSRNKGQSWVDEGHVASPGQLSDRSDSHNIWSGSVTLLDRGQYLFMHTGISQPAPDRPFLQSLNATLTDDPGAKMGREQMALSCALRDYDAITDAGYYLGPRAQIGSAEGEDGGPILAWRDPFTFVDTDGTIHMFHSAKTAPRTPAVAHAILSVANETLALKKLLPPLELPDADQYTQAEVPKIYHDQKRDLYYMLISACDRLCEGQPDDEVSKLHRLYKSTSLYGPWAPYHKAGSLVPGLSGLFGGSVLSTNFDTGDFTFIAPYTEMVTEHQQLTFATVRRVNIYKDPAEVEAVSA